jgi:hypothetical protein
MNRFHLQELIDTELASLTSHNPRLDERDLNPGSPITHLFSCDPLTGETKTTKATLYCPMSNQLLIYLPALSADQKKRLFIQRADKLSKLRDKKRKLDDQDEEG